MYNEASPVILVNVDSITFVQSTGSDFIRLILTSSVTFIVAPFSNLGYKIKSPKSLAFFIDPEGYKT